MNIGLFTDTYFPQVSGVATSIKTLKNELERRGHRVYIFTTTDPHVKKDSFEKNIFRFSSIPFVSFSDRRIAVRGLFRAYEIAKKLNLDIVHTQTEFSMGVIGKFVAKNLEIPCVHTYHTMYEDYLHYVANGKLLKPVHVKEATLAYCHNLTGIVAPSNRVLDTLTDYGVKSSIRIIPTGVNVDKFAQQSNLDVRKKFHIASSQPVILSLSRLSYEKNISALIALFPSILKKVPDALLMIVGDGPSKDDLERQVKVSKLEEHVIFVGEINNEHVNSYYQAADVFASTSSSESQGLTYIEAMAAGIPVVVGSSPYTNTLLESKTLGMTYDNDDGLIDDVVDYLKNPVDRTNVKTKKILKNKLNEISAITFGDRILSYYKDLQVSLELKDDEIDSDEISD